MDIKRKAWKTAIEKAFPNIPGSKKGSYSPKKCERLPVIYLASRVIY